MIHIIRGLNSDNTKSIANGGKDAINKLKNVNGEVGEPIVMLSEIRVVYNTATGTTTVYITAPPNSYWQAPPPYLYNSPTIHRLLLFFK